MRPPEFWLSLSGNTRWAVWFLLASVSFSGMAVCVKLLGRTMSVWEIAVLRSLFALVVLSPILFRPGPSVWKTHHFGTHVFRGALGMCAMVTFFYAVTHLDIALVSGLGFTRVLFIIVLAVLFLGEVVPWQRVVATVVGFAGVLICLQLGTGEFNPWTLCALAFALVTAIIATLVKRMTFTEAPLTIVMWTYVLMGLFSLVPAMLTWTAPTFEELVLIAILGAGSALGQTAVVHGLRAGEVTVVAPFDYTRLLFAAWFGYLFFAEIPGVSTWLGSVVIVASSLYITFRESRFRT